MPQSPTDGPEHTDIARAYRDGAPFADDYVINPNRVAEAILARIDELADERARFRRSLIYSVEMIESPDFDRGSIDAE